MKYWTIGSRRRRQILTPKKEKSQYRREAAPNYLNFYSRFDETSVDDPGVNINILTPPRPLYADRPHLTEHLFVRCINGYKSILPDFAFFYPCHQRLMVETVRQLNMHCVEATTRCARHNGALRLCAGSSSARRHPPIRFRAYTDAA